MRVAVAVPAEFATAVVRVAVAALAAGAVAGAVARGDEVTAEAMLPAGGGDWGMSGWPRTTVPADGGRVSPLAAASLVLADALLPSPSSR